MTRPATQKNRSASSGIDEPSSFQQRLEASAKGRVLISAVLICTLVAILISNLPPSELRKSALPIAQPLLDASGLSQNWNLFAPNPRRSTLRLEARIDFADGTSAVWRTPISDSFVGTYRAFRWRKWASYVVSDSRRALWPHAAAWLAQIHTREGKAPVRVTLYRQFFFAPKPGSGDPLQPPWREDFLYSTPIGRSG